jgi:hypothetical protein
MKSKCRDEARLIFFNDAEVLYFRVLNSVLFPLAMVKVPAIEEVDGGVTRKSCASFEKDWRHRRK